MKKWLFRLVLAGCAVLLSLATFVIAARAGWLTPDESSLRARYSLAESQFIEIDGETVHFTDEGSGPTILLVHGTFGSLRNWDEWVDVLSDRYRVIRFDRPRMGLSGPAPEGLSNPEQELRIIEALTHRLDVDRFFLVATSSAGQAGAAYAAEKPNKVLGLVLSNIAVGDYVGRSQRSRTLRFLLKIDPLLGGWRSTEFWRQVLLINFHNDDKVSEAQAREWSELNNRAQRMPPPVFDAAARGSETIRSLEQIQVPTLLLWSDHDHERPVEIVGQLGLEKLAVSDKQLEVVGNCGHIMPLDCGHDSVKKAVVFFDRIVATQTMGAQPQ